MGEDSRQEECESRLGNEMDDSLKYLQTLASRHGLPNKMNGLEASVMGIQKRKSVAAGDYVGRLFSDKAKAEKAVLKQLLNEITLREGIRKDILFRIDNDICQCENFLHEIRSITAHGYFIPEESLAFGTRRTSLETKVLELEELKREEEVKAWEDLSTLRRYLLFALRDYWAAVRRKDLLVLDWMENNENPAD